MDVLLAKAHGSIDALREKRNKFVFADRLRSQKANRDLRGAAVERRTEHPAAMIANVNQGAGCDVTSAGDVGTIDPEVAGFQALGAATRHCHH